MIQQNKHIDSFDSLFCIDEQLPRKFSVKFKEVETPGFPQVRVHVNDSQAGDIVNDNAYDNDNYRYHDIFHYSFCTLLGWSPCTRAMLRRKRKSNTLIDQIEDGARAAITEEAISLMIFTEAKRNRFFQNKKKVNKTILRIVKQMTETLEVKARTIDDWEKAILKSYEIFRLLVKNKGGTVDFDMTRKSIEYRNNI